MLLVLSGSATSCREKNHDDVNDRCTTKPHAASSSSVGLVLQLDECIYVASNKSYILKMKNICAMRSFACFYVSSYRIVS